LEFLEKDEVQPYEDPQVWAQKIERGKDLKKLIAALPG
jgi:hypothetical protein